MERLKINCEIANKSVELQFDIKKMPGEKVPCYMVSIDGLFRGYIKKEKSGIYGQLMDFDFTEEEMSIIDSELKRLNN